MNRCVCERGEKKEKKCTRNPSLEGVKIGVSHSKVNMDFTVLYGAFSVAGCFKV